jgi:PIN domain nuclease of toxin-antitoxin system
VKVLLDTHVVLWLARAPDMVSAAALAVLADPSTARYISAAAPWEMSIKAASGRLPEALPLLLGFDEVVKALVAEELPILRRHAVLAGQLDWAHRDPFDRMLAAQAVIEGLTLVTKDAAFATAPGVKVLW